MRLAEVAEPAYARHETFHPRYGWFRKAYSMAALDPHIFSRDDAPVQIGVGKNMVRAIRFWGLAAKLIVEDPQSTNRRAPGIVPTRLGHALFGVGGWDEYMEDPGTLWLLHWLLLAPRTRLPVWWLAFNEFKTVEFTEADLEAAMATQLEAVAEWTGPSTSSLKKDTSALLRTYSPADVSRRVVIDDLLDCPLRELGLISRFPATGRFRFTLGPKPTLPSSIIAYAVLDYIARTGTGGNTVTLSRLAHQPGAPGHAFKISETDLLVYLREEVDRSPALSLAMPSGAGQLAWTEDPAALAVGVLDGYYGAVTVGMRAGPAGDLPMNEDMNGEQNATDVVRDVEAVSRASQGADA